MRERGDGERQRVEEWGYIVLEEDSEPPAKSLLTLNSCVSAITVSALQKTESHKSSNQTLLHYRVVIIRYAMLSLCRISAFLPPNVRCSTVIVGWENGVINSVLYG